MPLTNTGEEKFQKALAHIRGLNLFSDDGATLEVLEGKGLRNAVNLLENAIQGGLSAEHEINAHLTLGHLLNNTGNLDGALWHYSKALPKEREFQTSDRELDFNWDLGRDNVVGILMTKLGNEPDTDSGLVANLERILEKIDHPVVHARLGDLYSNIKDFSSARAHCKYILDHQNKFANCRNIKECVNSARERLFALDQAERLESEGVQLYW